MDESKDIVPSNENKEATELTKASDRHDSLYDYAENLNVADVVFRANCLLCNSKYRKEAEELYSQSHNRTKVHRFLKDRGEIISYQAVGQHLKNHFLAPIMNARVQDYASSLKEFAKLEQGRVNRIRQHITMLERRVLMIESSTDEDDIESQRKTGDTVARLMEQIHKWDEQLSDIEHKHEPVKILVTKFDGIVRDKLEDITSPEARIALEEILDEFIKSAEDLDYR